MVPTLVDPKRRVRQASQECVAILAAFMGPTKAAPLIRSIELLESHFERGAGVLNAVQARLSRRQLPRITQDGLVEYSLQIPRSAVRRAANAATSQPQPLQARGRSESPNRQLPHAFKTYGADIYWILLGECPILYWIQSIKMTIFAWGGGRQNACSCNHLKYLCRAEPKNRTLAVGGSQGYIES